MKKMIATLSLLLTPTANVFAATEHHEVGLGTFWFNFIVFLGGLIFLARKPVIAAWKSRIEDLDQQVNLGAREIAAAELKLAEIKKRLNSIVDEKSKISCALEEEAKQEKIRLITEAKEQAAQIQKTYEQLAKAEDLGLALELQQELAIKVTDEVRQKLQSDAKQLDSAYLDLALSNSRTLLQ